MSGFVGADVEQLLALATKLDAQSRKFAEIAVSSTVALMVAAWTGAKIDRVRDDWQRRSKPAMTAAAGALAALAVDLRRQAEQQRVTSGPGAGSLLTHRAVQHGNADFGPAPENAVDRWEMLRKQTGKDGIRIQGIEGADHKIRYVVYLDGTDPSSWFGLRGIAENRAQFGAGTSTHDAIVKAMDDEIPEGSEVMIVGYSQGGIHAQAIAQTKKFNVTDVVTFGSPYFGDFDKVNGPNVVRIRDLRDAIPSADLGHEFRDHSLEIADKVGSAWRSIFGDDDGAVQHEVERLHRGQDLSYVTNAPNVKSGDFGTHTDPDTYSQGARQFEERAAKETGGRIALESQSRYKGRVVSDPDH